MRFNAQINLINFDLSGYEKQLDEFLTEEIKESARSWLRTVLVIIPTWSKASRATFEALAREVGFTVTYGPRLSKKDRSALGRSTGRGGLDIKKGQSYHFFYETDLRYLAFNEFNRAVKGQNNVFAGLIKPGPYRFQDAGANDFKSRSENVRLPSPLDFIRPQRI